MEEHSNRPKIRGKVVEIMQTQTFASGFSKRDIVVETGIQRPCPIKVSFKKDKAALLDGVAVGDAVIVEYALDGRQWQDPSSGSVRYFVDVTGLGVSVIASAGKKPAASASAMSLAYQAWTAKHGDDKKAFGEFCKGLKPGKPSKSYTDADWNEVKAAIEAPPPAVDDGAEDPDDFPF
jgi:hypothetical protein